MNAASQAASSGSAIALYYPWIHFQDDNWLKCAALYWPQIGRIVPHGHPLKDGPVTRALSDDLGVIRNYEPDSAARAIERAFLELVARDPEELRHRFGMHLLRESGMKPVFVAGPKMAYHLADALVSEGLAQLGRGMRQDGWLGLHPRFAQLYLMALCTEVSDQHGLTPVTDGTTNYAGTFASGADALYAILAGPAQPQLESQPRGSASELRDRFAVLALESVLPAHLDEVDVHTVIALRVKHEDAFLRYRQALGELAGDLHQLQALQPEYWDDHLRIRIRETVRPALDELDRVLNDAGLMVSRATVLQKVKMGAGLLTTGAPVVHATPSSAALSALGGALSIASVVRSVRISRRGALNASPVSYLWQIKKQTQPARHVKSVVNRVNRTLGG